VPPRFQKAKHPPWAIRSWAKQADDVKCLIQFGSSGPVAGFVAGSTQDVGATIVLRSGYFKNVYGQVCAAGGVCVVDERPAALGRGPFRPKGLTGRRERFRL
jgi:4-aminobutyrate aminotransferase-like enzyme